MIRGLLQNRCVIIYGAAALSDIKVKCEQL